MSVRDSTESRPEVGAAIDVLEAGLSFGGSFLRWFLVLNVAVGWIALSANLVRIHLALGDTVAAAFTVAVFIGPVVGVFLWVVSSKISPGSGDTGPDGD